MKTYRFSFTGRQSGAIGITYRIRDTYKADSLGEALYMLWTDYEHISRLQAKENSKNVDVEGIEPVKCNVSNCYPNRETDTIGAYRYTRSDSPAQ